MSQRIADQARLMLTNTILPFWSKLQDQQYGGYYGYMGYDLQVDSKADKGCILNSRILWFFSEAAMLLQDANAERQAKHAYDFLMQHCVDRTHGGVYWSLHYDGTPADTTKHTYNQAFAIYALSSYYRLTKDEKALKQAQELFGLIEKNCTDTYGYLEAFTVDWKPESNEKLSENGVIADKTMNTLLHVFEGYSGLYQAKPSDEVETALRRILKIYAEKVFDPTLRRQLVFFDTQYRSILDLHSYGHDIESSWLIDWGCGLLKDDVLTKRIGEINDVLADEIYKVAYRNHSLCNEAEKGVVNTTRIWWVQAEAVVGFLNAWEKNPQRMEYKEAVADIWHYIQTIMVDPREGSEWFWSVDENGIPHEKPIVEPWKCPYHNGRMCFELIRRNPDVQV